MATYTELRNLFSSDALRARLEVAVCIKAQTILQEETPSPERLAWAGGAFSATNVEADRILRYLLAVNHAASVETITGATDETLQTQTDAVIDKLYA